MADVKVGDRVHIAYEGIVQRTERLGFFVAPEPSGTHNYILRSDVDKGVIVMQTVEPAYETGAYYMDADGDVFRRTCDSIAPWTENGIDRPERFPFRPLRKLVPESADG